MAEDEDKNGEEPHSIKLQTADAKIKQKKPGHSWSGGTEGITMRRIFLSASKTNSLAMDLPRNQEPADHALLILAQDRKVNTGKD